MISLRLSYTISLLISVLAGLFALNANDLEEDRIQLIEAGDKIIAITEREGQIKFDLSGDTYINGSTRGDIAIALTTKYFIALNSNLGSWVKSYRYGDESIESFVNKSIGGFTSDRRLYAIGKDSKEWKVYDLEGDAILSVATGKNLACMNSEKRIFCFSSHTDSWHSHYVHSGSLPSPGFLNRAVKSFSCSENTCTFSGQRESILFNATSGKYSVVAK
ncbi:MAG: hypothetical protein NXI24_15155 [bacterium]|nr:hypothetical protein [bacterium]